MPFSIEGHILGGQVFKISVLRGEYIIPKRGDRSRLLVKYVTGKIELIHAVIQGIW